MLVEVTCGLVHASYSLPEWQAVQLSFSAPCQWWRREMSAAFSGLTDHIIRNQQTGRLVFSTGRSIARKRNS